MTSTSRDREVFEAFIRSRVKNPHVRERVLRLNPNPEPGERLRGWRIPPGNRPHFYLLTTGKREFIALYGREVFEALPNGVKERRGRRVRVVGPKVYEIGSPGPHALARARLIAESHALDRFYADDPRHRIRRRVNGVLQDARP